MDRAAAEARRAGVPRRVGEVVRRRSRGPVIARRGRWCRAPATSSPRSGTRRFGTLTYARSSDEAGGHLVLRTPATAQHRGVCLGGEAGAARPLLRRGRAGRVRRPALRPRRRRLDPERLWLDGTTTMRLRVKRAGRGAAEHAAGGFAGRASRSTAIASAVCSVCARRTGLDARVSLPLSCCRRRELSLTIDYAGRLEPQPPDRETSVGATERRTELQRRSRTCPR